MIRFSLVIQNSKNEFLVCKCPPVAGQESKFEFPGEELFVDTCPPFDWFLDYIKNRIKVKLAIDVEEIEKFEMYWRESPFWLHCIFTAKIKAGTPQKNFYEKILWLPISEITNDDLNLYGKQVYRKIDECSYCRYLYNKKTELHSFFINFFDREAECLSILETAEAADEESPVYLLAFKQAMIHLRASLIENAKLKNNITVQNYFRLYGRTDLSAKVDALLQIEVRATLTLREMIKESVDKYIAHYDEPSPNSEDVYKFCLNLFSKNGKLPLIEFMSLLNGCIMAYITEMWYDAGELGVRMSDRCVDDRLTIIEQGEVSALKLYNALTWESSTSN